MPHKILLTQIAASVILVLMKIKLQSFRVVGAVFRVADEMRRLPSYVCNPAEIVALNYKHGSKSKISCGCFGVTASASYKKHDWLKPRTTKN